MRHPLGKTKSGAAVYVDLIHSRAAIHIAQRPTLLSLIQEVLRQTDVHGDRLSIETDMGRKIGHNMVVSTSTKDVIFYAKLKSQGQETSYTRFVKNGTPVQTSFLTIQLELQGAAGYEVTDAWIGKVLPPRPGDNGETTESRNFWNDHAMVPDNQPLLVGSITKTCPY